MRACAHGLTRGRLSLLRNVHMRFSTAEWLGLLARIGARELSDSARQGYTYVHFCMCTRMLLVNLSRRRTMRKSSEGRNKTG